MSKEQELILLSKRLRKMLIEKQTDNETFINTVETLLTLLEEFLEE